MEQQQAAITERHPKMDFSQMTPLSLSDFIDELLDRAKAFAGVIEGNALDGVTAFDTLHHDAIAKLSWQLQVNLDAAKEANGELWNRYKQDTGFGKTSKGR